MIMIYLQCRGRSWPGLPCRSMAEDSVMMIQNCSLRILLKCPACPRRTPETIRRLLLMFHERARKSGKGLLLLFYNLSIIYHHYRTEVETTAILHNHAWSIVMVDKNNQDMYSILSLTTPHHCWILDSELLLWSVKLDIQPENWIHECEYIERESWDWICRD